MFGFLKKTLLQSICFNLPQWFLIIHCISYFQCIASNLFLLIQCNLFFLIFFLYLFISFRIRIIHCIRPLGILPICLVGVSFYISLSYQFDQIVQRQTSNVSFGSSPWDISLINLLIPELMKLPMVCLAQFHETFTIQPNL